MKIKKIKSHKISRLVISALILVAVLSSLSIYFYVFNGSFLGWQPTNQQSADPDIQITTPVPDIESPPTDAQIRDGQSIKKDSIENEGSEQSSTTSIQITASTQISAGGTIAIRTLIQRITDQGTCSLVMKKNSQTVTKTASVQSLPNGSTCQGFNIPFSELSEGVWDIRIEYRSGSDTASDESTVEVRA